MKKFLFVLMVLLLFLFFSGCKKSGPEQPLPDQNNTQNIETNEVEPELEQEQSGQQKEPPQSAFGGFEFGVEYGVQGLAKTFAQTGVHVVKPTPELVMWKHIQKSEGSGFDWSDVDAHVKEYQAEGFDSIELLLTAQSPWASRTGAEPNVTDTRPKPQFEDDYKAFVKASVERYDLDGFDDMPGLLYPVNYWGVEREFTGYFPGSGEQYVQVLKLAYPAIKEANPNAKVMLNALLMWDVFYGNPTEQEITQRFANPLNGKRKDLSDVHILLDAHGFFDVVDFHSLGDYSEIPPTVKWIENEMQKRGAKKEIVIGDAFPMSPLMGYGLETCQVTPFSAKVGFPVTDKTRCEASDLIASLRNNKLADYQLAHEWLEKNIAIGLAKKFVVAAASGVKRINIGNMEDWPIPFGAGTAQFMGLLDVQYNSLAGPLKNVRVVKEKRPGFFALKMVVENLDGFESVKKIEAEKGVFLYEFEVGGKKVLVGWFDLGEFYGLDKGLPTKKVEISWENDTAVVSALPQKRGQETGEQKTVQSTDGKIRLELGFSPVFVE